MSCLGFTAADLVAENSGIRKLSWSQIRGIYLGDSIKDAGGSRVIAINQLPNTPDRVAFDRKALNMSPDEVGRFWIDRRLRGHGAPPRSFAPPALLQRLIQKLPGAMTYVRLSQIIPGVRIVPIDDKKPGDAGYLLS